MPTVYLYRSVRATYKLIGLGLLMTSMSVFVVYIKPMEWISWASLVFFGAGLAVGIYQFFDKKPMITLNEVGIGSRSLGKQWVNWEVIQDAYILETNNLKYICLHIDENFTIQQFKSFWYKTIVKLNKALGFQELNLLIDGLDYDNEKLLLLILLLSKANQQEKETLLLTNNT